MKTLRFFILLLLSCSFTYGDVTAKAEDVSISQITFAYDGPCGPIPVRTFIVFGRDSIDYSQIQSGNILQSWNRKIEPADFDAMEKVIDQYDLYKSENVEFQYTQEKTVGIPLGRPRLGCMSAGSGPTRIALEGENLTHSFIISGAVCPEDLPLGVQELYKLRNELIEKYQQGLSTKP